MIDSPQRSRRLLIAAGEAAADVDALPFGVRELIEGAEEVLEWLASATDRARECADERLRTVLGQFEELGADDPLAEFPANHILIGLRGPDRAGWQERGLLDELIGRFDVPVTVFPLRG